MIKRLFIANRGEIAIRIARTASELGITTVGSHASDDDKCLHVAKLDEIIPFKKAGPEAYLDIETIISAAKEAQCEAIHPGYGFLSENADFARACSEAGVRFIGPSPESLDLFGDKANARAFAQSLDIPLLPGTGNAITVEDARAFMSEHGPIMLKAIAGGGGRGMRAVYKPEDLAQEFERCQSEALTSFGKSELYAERLINHARHIEVQLIGDGKNVLALGERECTLQRRNQKIIEIAPSPYISEKMRSRIISAAENMAQQAKLNSLCTFEFLIDNQSPDSFAFMEANPRIQVEHTITEAVYDVDLVQAQIAIANGNSLRDLKLGKTSKGYAVQCRINAETLTGTGDIKPSFGQLDVFEMPSGSGIRVDNGAYAGFETNPSYDSMLAKVIVHSAGNFAKTLHRTRRAIKDTRIEGLATNLTTLSNLLARPELESGDIDTRFIERHAAELLTADSSSSFFVRAKKAGDQNAQSIPDGMIAINAPTGGRVAVVDAVIGETVKPGMQIAIIEAMKMEHQVIAETAGIIHQVLFETGSVVQENSPLLFIEPIAFDEAEVVTEESIDLDHIRDDLAELIDRTSYTLDQRREKAVAKRHSRGQRTARENIDDLFDDDSFVEYGAFAIAAQRRRRSVEDLIENTPADGVITGLGRVNGDLFDAEQSRVALVAYDYTVLAGTQGTFNHKKTDRILDLAAQWATPVILYAEGGGGRPGDVDRLKISGLDVPTFATFAKISGRAPLIAIVEGRCFAGNAALAGCCDVIIATRGSNIGMSGPAMIEGGGLGTFKPEDIGPIEVQTKNGVVDIAVENEVEATAVAKKYLSYFQGSISDWEAGDQRVLRHLIPENRLRVYQIRDVLSGLFDSDSVLELRQAYGRGIITSLARIEGKPVGVIANDPTYLGGAIDGEAADKSSRFMRLCNAYGLPVISLIDTPGFMVGPDIEAEAQVRRVCRMYLAGSRMTTPFISVVLRKGYGLGAQAMASGGFGEPVQVFAWPTGEFGGMNLEGAVRLGFRKEMEAIEDDAEREVFFQKALEDFKVQGKASNVASYLEIDAVIDPADTRKQILNIINALPKRKTSDAEQVPFIDVW